LETLSQLLCHLIWPPNTPFKQTPKVLKQNFHA
jgi:hypothetical protein